jgi:hypothetical protein
MQVRQIAGRTVVAAVLAMLVWNPIQARAQAQAKPDPEAAREIARELGFDESDIEKVRSGEVVTRRFRKEDENELSVILFALAPLGIDQARTRFKGNDALEADTTILDWGSIETPATAESFAKLRLPDDELDKLAGDDAGDDFNLASSELALLKRRMADAEDSQAKRRDTAMRVYREILASRAAAYRSRGLAGIGPYDRDGEEVQPKDDLARTLPVKGGIMERQAPQFAEYLRGFPNRGEADASKLVWLLQVLNGRPAVILAHRAEATGENALFFAQRDFFVGHTFDALAVITGLVPVAEGKSALFYVNSTYTDQVTGFGSSAAHGIGRKIMTKEILALFEAVKAEL